MYPELISLFDGKLVVYTYSLCIAVGLVLTALCFRLLTKKLGMNDKSYEFYSFMALVSIVVGFIFAYLFQDLYTFLDKGYSNIVRDFEAWRAGKGFRLTGGITFMGGLLGGAGCFIVGTLIKRDKQVWKDFPLLADIAAPCILLAHGFGRVGCFFGGCCYGKPTDSWLGVDFPNVAGDTLVHPTQLYEALFCFIAFGIMMLLLFKVPKRGYLIAGYGISYSIFRFFIEYLRGDNRGGADIGVSPSQVQSFVFIAICCIYVLVKLYFDMKKSLSPLPESGEEQIQADENEESEEANKTEVEDEDVSATDSTEKTSDRNQTE